MDAKSGNYAKSNSITTIPNLKITGQTKILYRRYREVSKITNKMLQTLADAIFADLRLNALTITFAGRRPHTSNGRRITREVLGVHTQGSFYQSIRIYKLTAAKQQLVSAKSAISTLIHEINHNIDINILKLDSIHSKGFYMRLKQLTIAIS